jgi:hypothetical protein
MFLGFLFSHFRATLLAHLTILELTILIILSVEFKLRSSQFRHSVTTWGSRNDSVRIAMGYGMDGRGSIPGRGK